MKCVHFIGFKPGAQDWWNAIRIFGRPDFVHRKWDERAAHGGEIDWENDILVFTGKEFEHIVHPFSVDDSAMGIPSDEELTRLGYPGGKVRNRQDYLKIAKMSKTTFRYYDPSLKWVGGESFSSMQDFGSRNAGRDCFALETWPAEKIHPWYGDNVK